MTEPKPIACTLGGSELRQRLDEITTLGADSLLGHESKDGVHTLRFRPDERAHRRLEEIAAAEAQCCSFLDLSITKRDDELLLTIATTAGGEQLAEMLALSFLKRE